MIGPGGSNIHSREVAEVLVPHAHVSGVVVTGASHSDSGKEGVPLVMGIADLATHAAQRLNQIVWLKSALGYVICRVSPGTIKAGCQEAICTSADSVLEMTADLQLIPGPDHQL